MSEHKWVYDFAEGSRDMRELLGGKGANVAEMTRVLGTERVPAGFTITTEACVAYMRSGSEPEGLDSQVADALGRLEESAGKRFGDDEDPLLVSVRSGARESMPGMLDTILNVGLNDRSVLGLAGVTGNERFAWDSYRRLVQMFGNVVEGVEGKRFEDALAAAKRDAGVDTDASLSADALKKLVEEFKGFYDFPQDPQEQLRRAILAVFDSWTGERAVSYRRINRIPDDWGTAVNVQQMVFGNKGDDSATGRRLQPRRGDRRAGAVGRLPGQRAGRGRGVRRPHPARHLRARRRDARGARAADGDHAHARGRVQGHAGRRVHGRGGAAVHAPDPQRQAAGAGRGAVRGRRGLRGAADARGGAAHDRRLWLGCAAASDVRPQRRL